MGSCLINKKGGSKVNYLWSKYNEIGNVNDLTYTEGQDFSKTKQSDNSLLVVFHWYTDGWVKFNTPIPKGTKILCIDGYCQYVQTNTIHLLVYLGDTLVDDYFVGNGTATIKYIKVEELTEDKELKFVFSIIGSNWSTDNLVINEVFYI